MLLLVDVSGSMAGDPINQARAAMQAFVQNLDPADSVAIIAFSAGVTPVQDFTTDRAVLNNAIAALPAVGDTALYDAVIAAANKIGAVPAANGKRLVVLLSDGESTIGVEKRAASIAAIQQAGVNVVAIGEGRRSTAPTSASSPTRAVAASSKRRPRRRCARSTPTSRQRFVASTRS